MGLNAAGEEGMEVEMGGLVEARLRRWPVSGGEESERARLSCSRSAALLGASRENTARLELCVGVLGGDERPEAKKQKSQKQTGHDES